MTPWYSFWADPGVAPEPQYLADHFVVASRASDVALQEPVEARPGAPYDGSGRLGRFLPHRLRTPIAAGPPGGVGRGKEVPHPLGLC